MKPVVFRRIAQKEVDDTHSWYEDRQKGFGDRFFVELEKAISVIKENPKLYQKVKNNVRQALLESFPYSILYLEEETRVVVFAVFHQSRDPVVWEKRVL
jgi:plasmid stabilization system protein ParE